MIKPLDRVAVAEAQSRQDSLTKPQGSLGRLEELSIQLAGIQGKTIPQIKDKAIITMAGDHGVVAEKIGNWPQEVTAQMVHNFLQGGAGINVIAGQVGARIISSRGLPASLLNCVCNWSIVSKSVRTASMGCVHRLEWRELPQMGMECGNLPAVEPVLNTKYCGIA